MPHMTPQEVWIPRDGLCSQALLVGRAPLAHGIDIDMDSGLWTVQTVDYRQTRPA